ncbi:hypothetical protein NC651_001715 [Populus alba x Populus x berolinensis]|nr:hypothetical protein NC651_001715 [Populus alba x Populus x berolinensis]
MKCLLINLPTWESQILTQASTSIESINKLVYEENQPTPRYIDRIQLISTGTAMLVRRCSYVFSYICHSTMALP